MNKKTETIIAFIIGFIFIGLLTFVLNHNKQKPIVQTNKLQIVASFYPLYFFSEQIAGDKANVTNITPAGAEPHDYEPTAQDIAQIEKSKLLVLDGTGLEAWGNNIKQNLNPKNTTVLTVGDGIINQKVMEDGQNVIDPHIWLSPPLVKQIADKITLALIQIDPVNSNYYQTNANSLKTKLDSLDAEYKQGLSNCAEKNIITSHAAFGYLATTYGLNQVPIAGLSPDAEPSPQQLADITKFAKDNNVKYIFFESLVSPKLSDTIANEIGAKTLVLNPIEGLTNDEISQGKNYFTEMQNNLSNLKIALLCK
jgi:zinc transport system substrate-binding protein